MKLVSKLILAVMVIGINLHAQKIAFVDFEKVMTESKEGKFMNKQRQENLSVAQESLQPLREKYMKAEKDLETYDDLRGTETFSNKVYKDKAKAWQEAREGFSNASQAVEASFQQQEFLFAKSMLGKCSGIAKGYAEKNKYDCVMQKADIISFYVKPELDITDYVIGELDKEFMKSGDAKKK